MATLVMQRQPHALLDSPYRPLKYVTEIHGSGADDFISCQYDIQIWDGSSWVSKSMVRVQEDIDTTGYTGSSSPYKFFSVDISSIVRNELSYDLRPLLQHTGATSDLSKGFKIKQDITQSQVSNNASKQVRVKVRGEYIDANGDFLQGSWYSFNDIRVVNASFPFTYNSRGTYALSDYWHHELRENNNSEFLTNEPHTSYIREDECQYLSVLGHSGNSGASVPETLAWILFYDHSDTLLTYSMKIDHIADGDGTYTAGMIDATSANVSKVCQIGIGTRNIMANSKSWVGIKPSDLSDVKYYTVQVFTNTPSPVTPTSVIKKYYIDRDTEPATGFVRFHWQNRLGGIDSYTCKAGTIEEVSRKATTYSQNRYKNFTQDMGIDEGVTSDWDAVSNGVGGNLDVSRHGLTVGSVDYIKSYSASTRPLSKVDALWLEELFTSANVWVEMAIPQSAQPHDVSLNNQYVPVVIKDGSKQVVDSDGLVTMELQYVMSNNTIIPHN